MALNRGNHGFICVILSLLTCLPLIKTFCILLSKLRGRLFTIFTVYIVSVFLACFYCDRLPAWSCPLKRAVYSTPDNQCLDSGVLYIPFIHSGHNANKSLGVGRDIITVYITVD